MKWRQARPGATECGAFCHPTGPAWAGALHLSQADPTSAETAKPTSSRSGSKHWVNTAVKMSCEAASTWLELGSSIAAILSCTSIRRPRGNLPGTWLNSSSSTDFEQHRQRPDVYMVDVPAGELGDHTRRQGGKKCQAPDILQENIKQAGRVALGTTGQLPQVLRRNCRPLADRTLCRPRGAALDELEFHIAGESA